MNAEARRQNWVYRQILEKKPVKVYLGLGSNLGDRAGNLRRAVEWLGSSEHIQVLKRSSLYETEPVDCAGDQWFLNQTVYLVTVLPLHSFFYLLQQIEEKMGRIRTGSGAPRTIDVDILFFGEQVVTEPELQIPHPRLHERRFVLEPLCELNPQLWHPVIQKSVAQLLRESPRHEVRRFSAVSL